MVYVFWQNSRPVTKFTEDFDFMAMNEKFKKDEVWGHLGKSNKSHSNEKEGDGQISDGDDSQDEDDAGVPKVEIKVDVAIMSHCHAIFYFCQEEACILLSISPVFNSDCVCCSLFTIRTIFLILSPPTHVIMNHKMEGLDSQSNGN